MFLTMPIQLGLDLQGGIRVVLEAQETKTVKADQDAVVGAMEVIRGRIDGLGVTEPIIRRKGTKQIVVELPGIKNPERAMSLIGETALLEFVEGEWAPEDISNLPPEKLQLLIGSESHLENFVEKMPKEK